MTRENEFRRGLWLVSMGFALLAPILYQITLVYIDPITYGINERRLIFDALELVYYSTAVIALGTNDSDYTYKERLPHIIFCWLPGLNVLYFVARLENDPDTYVEGDNVYNLR